MSSFLERFEAELNTERDTKLSKILGLRINGKFEKDIADIAAIYSIKPSEAIRLAVTALAKNLKEEKNNNQ